MPEKMHKIQSNAHTHRSTRAVFADCAPWRGACEIFVPRRPERAQLGKGPSELAGFEEFCIVVNARVEVVRERVFFHAPFALARHTRVKARRAESHHAIDKIADDVGQILIYRGGKVFPGEVRI